VTKINNIQKYKKTLKTETAIRKTASGNTAWSTRTIAEQHPSKPATPQSTESHHTRQKGWSVALMCGQGVENTLTCEDHALSSGDHFSRKTQRLDQRVMMIKAEGSVSNCRRWKCIDLASKNGAHPPALVAVAFWFCCHSIWPCWYSMINVWSSRVRVFSHLELHVMATLRLFCRIWWRLGASGEHLLLGTFRSPRVFYTRRLWWRRVYTVSRW